MKYVFLLLLGSCKVMPNYSYIMKINNVTFICKRQLDSAEYKDCVNTVTKEKFSKIFISNQITVWRKDL